MSTPVAYARISRDRTGAGLGVERQAEDCRELATRLGLPEPAVISDNDMSAYSGKPRPGYSRLLAGLRDGRWDTLLVWHVDRLTRSPRDLEEIVDVVNGRVSVHTVRGGEIDLSSAEGRLHARMLGSIARYESEHKADRIRRKHAEIAEAGGHHGGPRPFGFEADGLTVRPDEAAVIADMTERVIAGESLFSLVNELRADGVPTARGAEWDVGVLRDILRRPRNAGLRTHRGEILGGAAWEGIVDRATWEACQAVLADPARRTSRGNQPRHLCSGIALCGACGALMRAGGRATYRCMAHACVTRKIELVDMVVDLFAVGWLRREHVNPAPPRGEDHDAVATVAKTTVLLEQLEDRLADGDLSRAAFRRQKERLGARLAEAEQRVAMSRVPDVLDGVTAEGWKDLPLERRRAVVRKLWTVTVLPSTRNRWVGPESVVVTGRLGEPAAVVATGAQHDVQPRLESGSQ